jgi:hypothetical protein
MFGAGLIFLAQAAITRIWGAESLGDYLLLIAATNIMSVVLPLGFETIGAYFAAEYRIKGEGRLLRGFMLRAYGHVIVLFALVAVGGQYAAGMMGPPGQVLVAHWWPLCLMMFGNALTLVSSCAAHRHQAALRLLFRRFAGANRSHHRLGGDCLARSDGRRPVRRSRLVRGRRLPSRRARPDRLHHLPRPRRFHSKPPQGPARRGAGGGLHFPG